MDEIQKKLLEQIQKAVTQTVVNKKIGIAFSGGVDSTLISKILSDMNYDVTLLTIGFVNSHDILFSKQVNEHLEYSHHILEIDPNTFGDISTKIHDTIKTENLSWNENCIAFYYVAKLAKSLELDTVITANGIDELFCGYNAYREAFLKGDDEIHNVMNSKLDNELKMMKAVNLITSEFKVNILQPLLSSDFISYAKTIPLSEKISDSEDLYRKHIIRNLAKIVDVPELSYNKEKSFFNMALKFIKH